MTCAELLALSDPPALLRLLRYRDAEIQDAGLLMWSQLRECEALLARGPHGAA
jgi:hypothetical protein